MIDVSWLYIVRVTSKLYNNKMIQFGEKQVTNRDEI